jgi:carboxyl-terminal processing protease
MVNGLSASASEFLAAALQDYHRAIIVGGQTYGKASMQNLHPLDPKVNINSLKMDKSNLGFGKITINKIYRITGRTAQRVGVMPDILLPDIISQLKFREAYLPLALPSDSVQKKTYYQALQLLPLKELTSKSATRIKGNSQFIMLEQYGKWVAATQEVSLSFPLDWMYFKKQTDEQEKEYVKLKNGLNVTTNAFTADGHHFQQQHMQMDEYVDTFAKAWIKKLQQDITLEESFHIICDYITINTRK